MYYLFIYTAALNLNAPKFILNPLSSLEDFSAHWSAVLSTLGTTDLLVDVNFIDHGFQFP